MLPAYSTANNSEPDTIRVVNCLYIADNVSLASCDHYVSAAT